MILYRPMVDGDVPAGLALCRAAGWNQTAEDWELFLRLSPQDCCVAVDEDGVVRGTVTTVRYDGHFSWIGMVLVDPPLQRQGIGIQLLRESLHILRGEETVKLDATPAGRKVYVQLEFVDEYPISRMEGKKLDTASLPPSKTRLMERGDFPSLLRMDRDVFGASREKVLQSSFVRAPEFAFVSENEDGIQGYCFGRRGHHFAHIGPVVSRDLDTAKHVAGAALRNSSGSAVVMDCLHHTPEWLTWLSALGFREQRPLVRMYRGANAFPGRPEMQFAILGPEFG